MIALTIYSRPGCHLCDEMRAVVTRVTRELGLATTLADIDISTDADLESRYGVEIPVLLINGKKAAKYCVTDIQLTRLLNARDG